MKYKKSVLEYSKCTCALCKKTDDIIEYKSKALCKDCIEFVKQSISRDSDC